MEDYINRLEDDDELDGTEDWESDRGSVIEVDGEADEPGEDVCAELDDDEPVIDYDGDEVDAGEDESPVGSWVSRHRGVFGLVGGFAAAALVAGVCFGVLSSNGVVSGGESGPAASSGASASVEPAAAKGSVITLRVGAEGYDPTGSSPALLRIMGVGNDGRVSEFYVIATCNSEVTVNLVPGSYDATLAVAPVNPDGTTYSAGESLGFEVADESSGAIEFTLTPAGALAANAAQSVANKASGILNAGDVLSPDGIAPSDYITLLKGNLGIAVDTPTAAVAEAVADTSSGAAAAPGSPTSLNATSGASSSAASPTASASAPSAGASSSGGSTAAASTSGDASSSEKKGEWKRVIVTPEVREVTPIYDKDGNVVGEEDVIVQEAEYEVRWVEG